MDEQMELILRGAQFKKLLDERAYAFREKYQLKKVEVEILYYLSRCGERNTSTDIHNQLLMNKGHISQAVESLLQRKYLSAIPDKEDRRYIHYELTEDAKQIIAELASVREKISMAIFEGVTEEEQMVFHTVAKKISGNIEKLL